MFILDLNKIMNIHENSWDANLEKFEFLNIFEIAT